MAAKSDAIIKLVLVFVISLLSFAVGTFVGKKYSDQQHKIATYEPTRVDSTHASTQKSENKNASAMTDEEIARLAEEFVTDENEMEVAETQEERSIASTASEAHAKRTPSEPLAAADSLAHGEPKAKNEAKPQAINKRPRLPAALPKNVAQYPTGKFTVQVASFSAEADAKKRAEELKNRGYSAFYIPAKVNGQTWYRVSVGQFPTEQEAKSYRTEFMSKTKIESAIIQKIVH